MVKKPPALGELEQPATSESPDFLNTPEEYGQSIPAEESVPEQTGWEQAPEEGLSDLEKWRLGVPLTSVDATPEETAKSRNIAAFKQAFPTASDKTNATFSGLVNGDEGITMVDAVDAEQEVGDFGIQWEGEGRGLRYGRILRSSLESMWANPDTQHTGKRAALLAHAKRYYKTVAKPENEEDLASWFDAVAGDFIRKEQAGRLIGPYDPLELEERSFFGAAYETTKGVGARLILARDFSKHLPRRPEAWQETTLGEEAETTTPATPTLDSFRVLWNMPHKMGTLLGQVERLTSLPCNCITGKCRGRRGKRKLKSCIR